MMSQLVLAAERHTLITRYENRYSCEAHDLDMRYRLRQANFYGAIGAAHMKHFSECCRAWSELTLGKYERFYDGVTYQQVESELDDWQVETRLQEIIDEIYWQFEAHAVK